MNARRGATIHELLQYGGSPYFALRKSGLTAAEEDALEADTDIADAAVRSIRVAIKQKLDIDEAVVRREKLAIRIADCTTQLSVRERNCLRSHGIDTIGTLVMWTEVDLKWRRGIGPGTLLDIERMLAEFELELLGSHAETLPQLIYLYGGAEYIPAHYMAYWQRGLDDFTMRYLDRFESLGDLVTTSAGEFFAARDAEVSGLLSERKTQLFHMRSGLQTVNLTLRGE